MTTLGASATIGDRFAAGSGRFPLSGVQALIRLIVDVRRADRAQGLDTAAFVSGWLADARLASPRSSVLIAALGYLPGAGGWAVTVEGLGAVGVPGGGGPVGVQDQGPAPPVDHDLVMVGTQKDAVGEAGRTAVRQVLDVVHLAG